MRLPLGHLPMPVPAFRAHRVLHYQPLRRPAAVHLKVRAISFPQTKKKRKNLLPNEDFY